MTLRIHLRQIYTFYSLYLAPGVPIARDDLLELLSQLPETFLLVGDFNSCNLSWGDTVASPERSYAAFSNFGFFSLLSELWSSYSLSDSFS